jgi:hypothetical protein
MKFSPRIIRPDDDGTSVSIVTCANVAIIASDRLRSGPASRQRRLGQAVRASLVSSVPGRQNLVPLVVALWNRERLAYLWWANRPRRK